MIDFADACLLGPVGAAVLAVLERRQRRDSSMFELLPDSQPVAVASASDYVDAMTFGELCSIAVEAGEFIVGPWAPDAEESTALALELAEQRRPIAAAIGEQFALELHEPVDVANQQWWTSPPIVRNPADGSEADFPRLFVDFDRTYGEGEFTWAGLWTTNKAPTEVHDDLICAWDILADPISRLRVPVNDGVSVFEIHRPNDWVGLIASHGIESSARRAGTGSDGSRAACLVPDWAAVGATYDAVHLSWAGFITTHDLRIDLDDWSFTLLGNWGSERTHWLGDCFGDPEPMESPLLTGRINSFVGIDTVQDPERAAVDIELFTRLLGR